ncbi:hypothetical protein Vse01_41930 [Micromonospora sediminimaris]|uniref:ATP-grasp domain-containing protein n=1 Tax=Micromonospora sediminimaris TaxID=547162 RepID=A0A9W5XL55_9ACTN|nr:hypothetical protein Vse01_41930 [Micromonospora sediminimaris]
MAVVDHDALTGPGRADQAVALVPAGGEAVYRGWMLRSEQYAAFAEALSRRGVTLRTSPEQYRQAHELPGWYAALAAYTPTSVWTGGDLRADFDRVRVELGNGPAVLRDYTKSMKHYWHEAVFIPDLADSETAWKVASRLRHLREDDFVGGFVLRRYERFTSVEARTWWVNGVCVLVSAHPDTPNDVPHLDVDLVAVTPVIAALGLPFITVDLALRDDGVWRIIEIGDGQVSDRPATTEPSSLVTALLAGTS